MESKNKVIIVIIFLALFFSILAVNFSVASERTVLNPDFVNESIEEGNIHESAYEEILLLLDDIAEEDEEIPEPLVETLKESISPEIILEIATTNVDTFYTYLDGETDDLVFELDLNQVRSNFNSDIESKFVESDISGIIEYLPTQNEDDFNDVIYEYNGTAYTISMIDNMLQDEASYDQTVNDYKNEIQATDPSRDVYDILDEILLEVKDEKTNLDEPIEEEFNKLLIIPLEHISKNSTYTEFIEEMDEQRKTFSEEYSSIMFQEIVNEVPEEIEVDDEELAHFDETKQYLQLTWLIIIGLVILIALLIYLLWFATKSVIVTTSIPGLAALLSATSVIVITLYASNLIDMMLTEVSEEIPELGIQLVNVFSTNILYVLQLQSIIIALIGVVLLGITVYYKKVKLNE